MSSIDKAINSSVSQARRALLRTPGTPDQQRSRERDAMIVAQEHLVQAYAAFDALPHPSIFVEQSRGAVWAALHKIKSNSRFFVDDATDSPADEATARAGTRAVPALPIPPTVITPGRVHPTPSATWWKTRT